MNKRALFLVEGERDCECIREMGNLLELPLDVVFVRANIHMLYPHLKKENFMVDIIDFIKDWDGISEQDKTLLESVDDFAYLYLVFDFDVQHHFPRQETDILGNAKALREMVDHFSDETDFTIGKLYINYPMFESLRDYDNDDLGSYKDRNIGVEELLGGKYKQIVDNRGCRTKFKPEGAEDLRTVTLLNVKKANYIVRNEWDKPDYMQYRNMLEQEKIANAEVEILNDKKVISVINSTTFIALDYWGNKDGFYDSI